LAGARDQIRRVKPTTKTAVIIEGGDYELSETFVLEARDSGTESAPVIYQGADKAQVRILGGKKIPFSSFVSARDQRLGPEARAHVVQMDLKQQQISDFGKMGPRGFSH